MEFKGKMKIRTVHRARLVARAAPGRLHRLTDPLTESRQAVQLHLARRSTLQSATQRQANLNMLNAT
ncbi:hypothetical protein AL037_16930 [Salipiger aestuarii]|nr:hypothetical protein AL037_16930 [Salipiger aestuarii]